jgi:hypothetical protein
MNSTGPEALTYLDISRPNVARVYNCLLGGKENFAADRQAVATRDAAKS